MSTERIVEHAGVQLSVEEAGEGGGTPVVLLHGLTATRRYVVMGSNLLARRGHRVVAYDARGHGRSSPAPRPDAYGYGHLTGDLEAVLDALAIDRAVLAGASMGAHTLLRLALQAPERVRGMVAITPAYDPIAHGDAVSLERWDALADGLRCGGIEGFIAAYRVEDELPARWQDTVRTVLRQRMAEHADLAAVADALRAVPRSRPFDSLNELRALTVPAVVVASRDEADPGHPFAVGAAYAAAIPGARLMTEEPGTGKSPLAWQGAQLSRIIAEVAAASG